MIEKALNILLVEDDEVDVMNVRRAFERNRIANPLHVAPDGIEAHLRRGILEVVLPKSRQATAGATRAPLGEE